MIVRNTRPEEAAQVNRIFGAAFSLPAASGPAEAVPSGKRHHFAAFDEKSGQMMSTLTVSDYEVRFDWGSARMGGIGGVATLPQYRRLGCIRGCFQEALKFMYDGGYELSYLFPFSNAFYRQFGYESCVRRLRTRVRLSLLKPDAVNGTLALADAEALEDIRRIDRAWEARYNMSVLHTDEDHRWVSEAEPEVTTEYTWIYRDPQGVPQAYTTFRTVIRQGLRCLSCSRFFFLNREGFQGLMGLLCSMAADFHDAEFYVPGDCDMEYLLPEWSMGALEQIRESYGMVRVINAEQVLKKCHCHGCTGRLTIRLHDPMIPRNDDTFTVDWKDGHVICVERTALEPDAELDIAAFSALICGACDLDQAELWMKGLRVLKPEAYPSLMFYRKPMMITDFF